MADNEDPKNALPPFSMAKAREVRAAPTGLRRGQVKPPMAAPAVEAAGKAAISDAAKQKAASVDLTAGTEEIAVPPVAAAPAPLSASLQAAASNTPRPVKEKDESVQTPPSTADDIKAASAAPVRKGLFSNFMLEETTMDMSANFSGFQEAITEAQAKAKAAFDKSTSVLGEVSDFAKGNVEAAVESGKIFAEGVQGLGSEFVSESRAAFEVMTGDIKELAAAKSPTDFFKLQSDLVRKNFDTAVAYSSKNSEAMLKLFSDAFAPLSGRMSIAVEKARAASAF